MRRSCRSIPRRQSGFASPSAMIRAGHRATACGQDPRCRKAHRTPPRAPGTGVRLAFAQSASPGTFRSRFGVVQCPPGGGQIAVQVDHIGHHPGKGRLADPPDAGQPYHRSLRPCLPRHTSCSAPGRERVDRGRAVHNGPRFRHGKTPRQGGPGPSNFIALSRQAASNCASPDFSHEPVGGGWAGDLASRREWRGHYEAEYRAVIVGCGAERRPGRGVRGGGGSRRGERADRSLRRGEAAGVTVRGWRFLPG